MADDEYAAFAGGRLKLKGVSESGSKKKKRKRKERKEMEEKMPKVAEAMKEEEGDGSPQHSGEVKHTKAEMAFKKMQEKMQTERIKQKAIKTHKQRVEEFNRHLDNLTEHFDIPKVSWTK